jgi:hypothetical protein
VNFFRKRFPRLSDFNRRGPPEARHILSAGEVDFSAGVNLFGGAESSSSAPLPFWVARASCSVVGQVANLRTDC